MRERTPAGRCLKKLNRQWIRLKNCGGVRGILLKLAYKRREHRAMGRFGSRGFPDEERIAQEREAVFPQMVKISILVPLWNNDRQFQREMLDSVMKQTYQNWELCLADGSDEAHSYSEEICREYAQKSGGRIRYCRLKENRGIAGNTNACLTLATGTYIGLLDQDDILHPSALYEYVRAINEQGADYLYCDETTFQGCIDHMLTMHFKPDYAPDNLMANNYICHFSVFKRSLLEGEELFRSSFDGSQDHDMILRLTDRAETVVHVPRLLYYWRRHAGSVASGIEAKPYAVDAAKQAVTEALEKAGFSDFEIVGTRAYDTIFRIRYGIVGTPKISIVIETGTDSAQLRACVDSVRKQSTYPEYEILIVGWENVSAEIRAYYTELLGCPYCGDSAERSMDDKISIVTYRGEVSETGNNKTAGAEMASDRQTGRYAVRNYAVQYARGEYLLFLECGAEVITAGWMEELLMYAQRRDVGAVGAKLYNADETIRNAGIIIGIGADGTAEAAYEGCPRANLGYMGGLCYARNVSAVSDACLMVKTNLWRETGGFDERYQTTLGDVDFCLKLREKGLLNVFTPFAELYQNTAVLGRKAEARKRRACHRTGGRMHTIQGNGEEGRTDTGCFREKWEKLLQQGDPYYNPNFSTDRSDYSLKNRP